jgi:hypothetical protein
MGMPGRVGGERGHNTGGGEGPGYVLPAQPLWPANATPTGVVATPELFRVPGGLSVPWGSPFPISGKPSEDPPNEVACGI